ncbi:MAG: extracellular solute-binding protein [Oscillospiraceae bacterium]|nr:extracellular solute-binding protein [Oscillospiraceae bacterium]
MKKYVSTMLAVTLFASMTVGCSQSQKEPEEKFQNIHLTIASDIAPEDVLVEQITKFQQLYADKVNLNYTIKNQEEDDIVKAPRKASDIFNIANDQVDELYRSGTLLEITENQENVISSVGGETSTAAQTVMRDGKLYGYPLSSGNGYFLYYNKAYLSEDDISSLDNILSVAAQNGKKFTMDFSSGWYLFSFFKGAGLNLDYQEDKAANLCNWNATNTEHTGVAVTQAMLNITGNDGFLNLPNGDFVEYASNDDVIAGVSGQWHAEELAQAWGDNYAAAKLPTYTLDGEQVQMASFTGYRIVGVNAYSENPVWAMRLAEYLSNEETQLKCFETIGQCPANLRAAGSEEVKASPAVAATAEQAPYAYIQHVADPFWDASSQFGTTIAEGNPGNEDLQKLLDKMVGKIIIPVNTNQ